MTIQDLFDKVHKKGWLVSTAYEDGKRWTVGLRPNGDFTLAYGTGKTFEKALTAAITDIARRKKVEKEWKVDKAAKAAKAAKKLPEGRVRLKPKKRGKLL